LRGPMLAWTNITQTPLPVLSSYLAFSPVKLSLQPGAFIINPWPPGNDVTPD
jgi:hypothetical protein